jgi:hypothetical protein
MWLSVMFRYHLVMHLCLRTTDHSLNIEHRIYGLVITETPLDDYLLLKTIPFFFFLEAQSLVNIFEYQFLPLIPKCEFCNVIGSLSRLAYGLEENLNLS